MTPWPHFWPRPRSPRSQRSCLLGHTPCFSLGLEQRIDERLEFAEVLPLVCKCDSTGQLRGCRSTRAENSANQLIRKIRTRGKATDNGNDEQPNESKRQKTGDEGNEPAAKAKGKKPKAKAKGKSKNQEA